MLSDENVQRYLKVLYPVGLMLLLVPLADLVLRAVPPQFGSLQWRFGIVGLMFGNLGTIVLGISLIGIAAVFSGHRTVLRIVGFVTLLAAVVILATLALFLLDAVQMRRLANINFKRQILMSSVGALFTGLFGSVVLLFIGRGALASSRTTTIGRRVRPAAASPLVVAGPGAGETV